MKKLFPLMLIIVGIAYGTFAVVYDLGTMHRRIRCSVRHAVLFNTGNTPLHHPSNQDQFITQEDLRSCSEKVRRQYEAVVTDAYLSADPESHMQTYISVFIAVLFVGLGIHHFFLLRPRIANRQMTEKIGVR